MKGGQKKFSSRKPLWYRGEKCLNCGHPLDKSDVYCPRCSQLNSTKQLNARDYFAEFLSSIMVYDSRLLLTLRLLLFKPGILSKRFVEGERLKFANPFRFYLSVSIIYFLATSLLNPSQDAIEPPITVQMDNSQTDLLREFTKDEPCYYNAQDSTKAAALGLDAYYSEEVLDSLSWEQAYANRMYLYRNYNLHHKEQRPAIALEHLGHNNNLYNRWIFTRTSALYKIVDSPLEFKDYIRGKIPFFLFFFTPFYALIFLLIYKRDCFTYMEHIIFIFHIFSFIFFFLILFLLPDYYFDGFFSKLFFAVIGPIYFFLALKNFYEESILRTFLKFLFLSFTFGLGFVLSIIVFLAASVAIY